MELKENDYAMWLFNVPTIGNVNADRLLCGGMSCRDIYEMSSRELSRLLSKKQVMSVEKSRATWDFEAEKKKLDDRGIRFIPRIDAAFPEKLKNIPGAPFAIYVKGRLPDPEVPSVAVIGARMCSEYGRFMARQFGQGLAMAGVQVISGMARGIDGIAQNAALKVGGSSFAVLGCGVDVCYPEENIEIYDSLLINGGIISEFPPGTQPLANFFPMRNRIISALSDVVLVVEARQKSGTSITVDTALEQGREVLAIPGRVTDRLSDGCNHLISQGAGVAVCVEDVLERLGMVLGKDVHGQRDGKNKKETFERGGSDGPVRSQTELIGGEKEKEATLQDDILGILDIIPVSTSYIMEELFKRGKNISIPMLLSELMDLTGSGKVAQNGSYYRKIS